MEDNKVLFDVIDKETGEIIDEMKRGDYIVHQETDELIIKDFNGDKKFVKLFEGVNDLRKYLNN